MCFWPSGAASRRASICPAPKMAFWMAGPVSGGVRGVVVECAAGGGEAEGKEVEEENIRIKKKNLFDL